jgi:hypothetical protein
VIRSKPHEYEFKVRRLLEQLGGVPSPNSDFTSLIFTLPFDHTKPADPRILERVFGVLPARGARKGMFVTAAGGPGYAGLALADVSGRRVPVVRHRVARELARARTKRTRPCFARGSGEPAGKD